MKRRRWSKDKANLRGKSTDVPKAASLDELIAGQREYTIAVPPMIRFKAIMEMSIPETGRGRPVGGETARVIKAEVFRLLIRPTDSMRQMAETFFTDKPESERYDRYRAIVVQHAGKIKELLGLLKQ